MTSYHFWAGNLVVSEHFFRPFQFVINSLGNVIIQETWPAFLGTCAMDSSDSDDETLPRAYKRAAWCVVVLGLLVTVGGLPQVPVLVHYHQPLGFSAGRDSPGILGQQQLKRFFPVFAEAAEAPVMLVIRSKTGSVLTPEVEQFTTRVEQSLNDPRAKVLNPLVLGCMPATASVTVASSCLPSWYDRSWSQGMRRPRCWC